MKVLVYPADAGGCGHYRMTWPAAAVAEQYDDLDVEIIQPTDTETPHIRAKVQDTKWGQLVVGVEPLGADVVVLQRPLRSDLMQCIPFIQQQGTAVVVEVDDLFSAIDPQNKAWSAVQGGYRNHYNIVKACAMADMVTVTTPELYKAYAIHNINPAGRRLIPNYVPNAYLDIESEPNEHPVIGWTGSIETHPNDLQQMGGAVAIIVAAGVADFAVVGTGVGVHRRLGMPPDYEMRASEWVPLKEYPYAMAQFDVGVVPLDDTPFNNAKSWLKGLEFASLGVPFVASPTEPYIELQSAYGVGLLAKSRKWLSKLRACIDDHREFGAQQRAAVARNGLTIEEQAWQWRSAWELAWELRKVRA
jgi:hypothetical protein